MIKPILFALLRHALTIIGGGALATGYITQDDAAQIQQLPNAIDGNTLDYIGGAITLLGVGASIASKVRADKKLKSAKNNVE